MLQRSLSLHKKTDVKLFFCNNKTPEWSNAGNKWRERRRKLAANKDNWVLFKMTRTLSEAFIILAFWLATKRSQSNLIAWLKSWQFDSWKLNLKAWIRSPLRGASIYAVPLNQPFPRMGCLSIVGLAPELRSPVPIYTTGWREALWQLCVLPKNTKQCSRVARAGTLAWLLDGETSALTEATAPPIALLR